MQWLKLVNEDAGIQALKAANRQSRVTRGVDSVAPYPCAHPAQIGERRDDSFGAPLRERRASDRRQGDRRRRDVPVLLDTRSAHDRRGLQDRRGSVAFAGAPASRRGVDLYA